MTTIILGGVITSVENAALSQDGISLEDFTTKGFSNGPNSGGAALPRQ